MECGERQIKFGETVRQERLGVWTLGFGFPLYSEKRQNVHGLTKQRTKGGGMQGRAEADSGEETDKRLRARSGKAAQQKQEKCGRQKTRPSAKSKILELHWSARDGGGSRGKEGRESQARNKGGWKELRSGKKLQQY